jgi:hypothetical protein
MASHEAPAAVHDHIAADDLRRRALTLIDQFNTWTNPDAPPTRAEELDWEGRAYALLRELARG